MRIYITAAGGGRRGGWRGARQHDVFFFGLQPRNALRSAVEAYELATPEVAAVASARVGCRSFMRTALRGRRREVMCGLAGRRGRGQWSGWACLECELSVDGWERRPPKLNPSAYVVMCGGGAL